jgi:cytochrome c
MKRLWLVPVLAACSTATALAQDVAAGEALFKKCIPCHSVGEGARNKFGPQLNGLDGRRIGTASGYTYSYGYKSSAIVWSEATFSAYINDPKAQVPGSKMAFLGIKNEDEVRNLWAYLSQFNADGTRK